MFEWDEKAREANIRHNGVDFVRAARMFENPVLERDDARQFAGEARRIAIGHVDGYFMLVATAPRGLKGGSRRRIIEAWRASDADERIYRQAVPQAAAPGAGLFAAPRPLAAQPRGGLLVVGGRAVSLARAANGEDPAGS